MKNFLNADYFRLADGSEASEDKGRLPGPSQSFRLSLRITFFEFSVDAACRWEGGAHLVRQ
jgi:hypothetical protein